MIKLNTTGIFKGIAPLVIPEKIMTCVGITNIRALVAGAIDLNTITYEGVFQIEIYPDHIARNVVIITLRDDNGTLYYYPQEYIHSATRVDLVTYYDKTLIINLGAHKDIKTFHGATRRILNILEEVEGIKASARLINSSKPRLIKQEVHEDITRRREQNKDSVHNPYRLLIERERYIGILEARIDNFVKFFVEYLDTATDSHICCGDIITTQGETEPEIVIPEVDAFDAYTGGCGNMETLEGDAYSSDEYYISTSK